MEGYAMITDVLLDGRTIKICQESVIK